MLYSQPPSKSPQSKSKSKSFIQKKAKQSFFVWNIKKLGGSIDADVDVFKVLGTICTEERMTTASFARVKQSSKSL